MKVSCPHFAKMQQAGDLSLGSSQPHADTEVWSVQQGSPGVLFSWPSGTAFPVGAPVSRDTHRASKLDTSPVWTPGACGRTVGCDAVGTSVLCSPLTPQIVLGDRMMTVAFCLS